MSDKTDHLEDQIEAHRANVEETLDKMRSRLSVDQVVDDIGQIVGVQDLRGTLALTGRQMRENPLALGLIGIGLAWLLIGRGPSEQEPPDDARGGDRDRPSGGKAMMLPAVSDAPITTSVGADSVMTESQTMAQNQYRCERLIMGVARGTVFPPRRATTRCRPAAYPPAPAPL